MTNANPQTDNTASAPRRRWPILRFIRRRLLNWRERHHLPFNFYIHLIGIPLAVSGVVLLFFQPWYWGVGALVLGYLLQWIGHLAEGNDVGEWAAIKRLLGPALRRHRAALEPRRSQSPLTKSRESRAKSREPRQNSLRLPFSLRSLPSALLSVLATRRHFPKWVCPDTPVPRRADDTTKFFGTTGKTRLDVRTVIADIAIICLCPRSPEANGRRQPAGTARTCRLTPAVRPDVTVWVQRGNDYGLEVLLRRADTAADAPRGLQGPRFPHRGRSQHL